MLKTAKRSLLIVAIFLGVLALLLPLQAFAGKWVQQHPHVAIEDILPHITPTIPAIPTFRIAISDHIPFGRVDQQLMITPTNWVYLPIIQKPPPPPFELLSGNIQLVQDDHVAGLTTFVTTKPITLSFDELDFSYTPNQVKWWPEGQSDDPKISDYSTPIAVIVTNTVGTQRIMVEFFYDLEGEEKSALQEFTFFYIPNGDFSSDEYGNWNISEKDLISDNKLRLGEEHNEDNCIMATVGITTATLSNVQLPAFGDYYLRVEGTLFTQDQNPSNSGTYDAFEIRIDGNVVDRDSNPESPIRCDPLIERKVDIDARISLSDYSGLTTISLENHKRFDNFYNTYSEITQVWIDDE